MVEIRVREEMMNLPANQYRGYLFRAGKYLNIGDKGDIEYFKAHPELFEIKGMKEKIKEAVGMKEKIKEEKQNPEYPEEELEKMSFFEVKEIGTKIGRRLGIKNRSKYTDRDKGKLIKEIMKLQEEEKNRKEKEEK